MGRIVALVVLAAAVACTRVDRQLFTGLDRASAALQQEVPKVSLARYRELSTAFAGELTAAHARAQTSSEQAALAPYDAAHAGLRDILAVWEAKESTRSDLLPIREETTGRIARQYGLAVNTNEPPSIYASEAMQTIWDTTKTALTRATTH